MLLYKLTTQDHKTRKGEQNETTWGERIAHSGDPRHSELCSPGFIHAYTDPLLAVLLNPIHADITDPVLWECEGTVVLSDRGLKVGCRTLMTVRQLPLPQITPEQRVRFAILCAKKVCTDSDWLRWADAWLDGTDRTKASAAWAAATVARVARGTRAAWAATRAAWAATTDAAAWVAGAAEAATATATAATEAEAEAGSIDMIALAQEAVS